MLCSLARFLDYGKQCKLKGSSPMLAIRWIIRLSSSMRNNGIMWRCKWDDMKLYTWVHTVRCGTVCVVEVDMKMSVSRAVVHCLFCGPSYWSVWVCLLLLSFCEIPVSVEILFSAIVNDRWSTRAITAWRHAISEAVYIIRSVSQCSVSPWKPSPHRYAGYKTI